VQWAAPKGVEVGTVCLVNLRDLRQVDAHDVRAGHVKKCRATEEPEATAFAETFNGRSDHGLDKLSKGGPLRNVAGCIDSDIVSDHHPRDVCWLAHVTDQHVQVWRNGSVNET